MDKIKNCSLKKAVLYLSKDTHISKALNLNYVKYQDLVSRVFLYVSRQRAKVELLSWIDKYVLTGLASIYIIWELRS